jgi:hypothetical protein
VSNEHNETELLSDDRSIETADTEPAPAGPKLHEMSQHCGVIGDHAGCPREITLGTSPCECPCHRSQR